MMGGELVRRGRPVPSSLGWWVVVALAQDTWRQARGTAAGGVPSLDLLGTGGGRDLEKGKRALRQQVRSEEGGRQPVRPSVRPSPRGGEWEWE